LSYPYLFAENNLHNTIKAYFAYEPFVNANLPEFRVKKKQNQHKMLLIYAPSRQSGLLI